MELLLVLAIFIYLERPLFGWLWLVLREKYCWLAGWWLVLIWCERKTLLAGNFSRVG